MGRSQTSGEWLVQLDKKAIFESFPISFDVNIYYVHKNCHGKMHIDVFVYLNFRLSNFKVLIDLCFEKTPTMFKYENNIISYLYYI